ncbi:MAG: immune inhibitor A [Candidatus Zixiibacteriota bacterium]|nr:MAG: immune inhibitor A [candidate division Zixibacteria bacterium]
MFRIFVLVSLVIILAFFSINAQPTQEIISQIKLNPMTKEQYLEVRKAGFDILETPAPDLTIFATQADMDRLSEMGVGYMIIHRNLAGYYTARNTDAVPFGGFETFIEIVAHIDMLASTYPDIMTEKFSIGQTVENNEMWVFKISDNPDVDEDEPEIFFNSLIHAREPAAAASLIYFVEYLLTNYGTDPEVTDIIDNRELYFLPVYNPDGYLFNEYIAPDGGGMWRKNRRYNGDGTYGIDLNRNHSFEWGFDDIGSSPQTWSETYRGLGPFSEVETQNVRDFILSRDFTIIHNFHCYSNLEIWAPSYNRIYGNEEDFYCNLGDSLTQYNNYTPYVGWTLYPSNGGANDWAWCDSISKPKIISLTVEIGSSTDGFWPNPARIPILCEENVFPNLFLAKIADNPYSIAPPKTPTITSPVSAEDEFQVQWDLEDDINPAATYRLMEYTGKQLVTDDAEADYDYWETFNMSLSTARAYSGVSSWHTQSQYRERHWLVSKTPYEVKPNDKLRFKAWYDIEEHYDYFYAQISTDGGFDFQNMPCEWTTNDDPNNINLGNGMTGTSGGWLPLEFDLSAYDGEQVIFRLAYFTDDYTLLEGVYIDDVENVDFFQTSTEISSSITDTFYTFTSKPDGDYWYRVAATDAQGQEGRLSNITYTEVLNPLCCEVGGDVNLNGIVELLDCDYMVTWLWRDGPAPVCMEEADANGDLSIDILDIDYTITYLFRGGPHPVACHPL